MLCFDLATRFVGIGDTVFGSKTGIDTNTEVTIRTSRNDAKVVRLHRNPSEMFQVTKCDVCSCNTQHSCTFPTAIGKYFDIEYGKRIRGAAICNLCLGESDEKNCCLSHRQMIK